MKSSTKPLLRYFVGAFFIQFGVMGVCIPLHRIFIRIGEPVAVAEQVAGAMTNPTVGRLMFSLLSALAFILLTALASARARAGKDYAPFIFGSLAGTFLWQSIGEDLWHFSVGGEHFVVLESISALPLVILFLLALLYCARNRSLDWGVWCAVLGFAVNWLGHYVLEGVYPLVAPLCPEALWYRCVGLGLGSALLILGVYLGVKKAKAPRQWMLCSILCFFAVAVLAFGLMEG